MHSLNTSEAELVLPKVKYMFQTESQSEVLPKFSLYYIEGQRAIFIHCVSIKHPVKSGFQPSL